MKAKEKDIPIISSMGAGNKLDGSQFKVADIYKTKVCPLAKSNAPRTEKARSEEVKSSLFRRDSNKTDRGYGHQLQDKLYLSAGEQSTSVQSGVTYREVWHLFLPWQG